MLEDFSDDEVETDCIVEGTDTEDSVKPDCHSCLQTARDIIQVLLRACGFNKREKSKTRGNGMDFCEGYSP